jgi:HEPN domain-containing protein
MPIPEEACYRLQVAEGFLQEAREDIELRRWRSCADNSQLAAELAAKAVLGLLAPVGRTHQPSVFLRDALQQNLFPAAVRGQVERLAECAEFLGPEVHIKSDYGDEEARRTPWELFTEVDARQALSLAEEAVSLAARMVERGLER